MFVIHLFFMKNFFRFSQLMNLIKMNQSHARVKLYIPAARQRG